MTPWLKKPSPQSGPPMPGTVDYEVLAAKVEEMRRMGTQTPQVEYLWAKAPRQELDKWGEPLPLSPMQQDLLDRMFAILAAPFERGTALLHSSQLVTDEVDAIIAVYPDIYALLVEKARGDMLVNPPPYPAWAEAQLGILFGKPASDVYSPPSEATGKPPSRQLRMPEGTQADRRELAVREGR